jgi:hypothetical protein
MISRIWKAFRHFWETDRGLSFLLFFLVVLIFLVPNSGLFDRFGRLAVDAVFTLLLLAGVASISRQRGATIVVGLITVFGLAVRWIGRIAPSQGIEIAISLSGLVSIVLLAVVVLSQVFRAGSVNRHRILGAIAAYLLIGLAWAEGYTALALFVPDAFATPGSHIADPEQWLYFSFVTLTTIGYGDITPISSLARSLAVLEALTGQLYPAILLARLVGLEVSSSEAR